MQIPVAQRTGLAAILALAFVAAATAPAAAIGTSSADDRALAVLGDHYGSASFRHHFYRNLPNQGLSQDDHEAFLDAKDAAALDALAPL